MHHRFPASTCLLALLVLLSNFGVFVACLVQSLDGSVSVIQVFPWIFSTLSLLFSAFPLRNIGRPGDWRQDPIAVRNFLLKTFAFWFSSSAITASILTTRIPQRRICTDFPNSDHSDPASCSAGMFVIVVPWLGALMALIGIVLACIPYGPKDRNRNRHDLPPLKIPV